MVRLDDDQLNISPEVAASLGYAPARASRQPAVAPALAAPRRPGPGAGDIVGWIIGWIIVCILVLFGSFILLTVICFVITIVSGAAPPTTRPQTAESAPSPSPVPPHPIASPSAPEPRSVAVSDPAPQQQAPPTIETTNLEIESEQTVQPLPQSEAVQNNIEGSTASDPSSAGSERSEITVEEAKQEKQLDISQPPESEQREKKKVTLPKTKWHAEGGASAPPFSNWRWVCESRNGLRCGLQDVNGRTCSASSGMEAPSRRAGYPKRRCPREAWHGDAPRCPGFCIAPSSTYGERIDRGAHMTGGRWLAEIERVGTSQRLLMHRLFARLIFRSFVGFHEFAAL